MTPPPSFVWPPAWRRSSRRPIGFWGALLARSYTLGTVLKPVDKLPDAADALHQAIRL